MVKRRHGKALLSVRSRLGA